MPHEGNVPVQKVSTKKHIARLEKEKRQRKILLIGIISLLGIIVVVHFVLPMITNLIRPMRTVARVNSDKITVAQYQNRVRFERLTLERTFINYQLSSFAPYFQSQLLGVQNQLDDYLTFGDTILQNMIYEALISQDANERGITVTEEEIDEAIEEYFGFFAKGTPTPRPTVEYKPTSTLSSEQLALITATPLPTATSAVKTALPLVTNTPEVTATATATEAMVTSTPTIDPTATPIPPTPTAYTLDGFEMLHATVQADWEAQIKFADADFREYIRNSLYNQKLYSLITKDIAQDQEMIWARHILVTSEEQALEIKAQIDAGGDFGELALINSLDTANSSQGGDLGWIYKGQMVEEFENAAWGLTVGEISQPVKSSFGYHIIQVLGREVRQLTSDQFSELQGKIYQKYYEELSVGADIKISDIWASVVPSDPTIPAEYRIQTQ